MKPAPAPESAHDEDEQVKESKVEELEQEQEEEETEEDRKRRVAERLAKMGGFNPFAPGPKKGSVEEPEPGERLSVLR